MNINIFTQTAFVIARLTPPYIEMLGTGFAISEDGKIVTNSHVIGPDHNNIVVIESDLNNLNSYQDLSNKEESCQRCEILEIDPVRDLCVLQSSYSYSGSIPKLGTLDDVLIGDEVEIYGFPHCVDGRKTLTYQKSIIGAKILLESSSIKVKHAVLNMQSRPGQSGSLVYSGRLGKIVGILNGAYLFTGQGIGIIAGINPGELHQTTHCISAEYIQKMI